MLLKPALILLVPFLLGGSKIPHLLQKVQAVLIGGHILGGLGFPIAKKTFISHAKQILPVQIGQRLFRDAASSLAGLNGREQAIFLDGEAVSQVQDALNDVLTKEIGVATSASTICFVAHLQRCISKVISSSVNIACGNVTRLVKDFY